jgi:outer membrane protein W
MFISAIIGGFRMRTLRKTLTLSLILTLYGVSLNAQALEKRHQIGLRVGMWNQVADTRTVISADGVTTSVGSNGVAGTVTYNHWLEENVALDISIGGMAIDIESEVGTSGVTSKISSIGYILLGAKYYFPKSTYASSVRPFAMAGVGPFMGDQSETRVGLVVATEQRSEVAFGGKLALGIDFPVSRHFMAGVTAGYNFMTDFDEPIGGSDNYSGPEFLIGFGYLFGSGAN